MLLVCLVAKENTDSKTQAEQLIRQVEKIERKEETKPRPQENEVIFPVTEPTLKIPKEYEGWDVIGRLTIPKIHLVTYILSTTTKENLNKSVTKLYGPNINQVGNFCITGHNYRNSNMFSKLKKLEIGDEFTVTDKYNNTISYRVYAIQEVQPDNVQCLEQETGGEREVTLITCTVGALKRLIVKAAEIYD